MPPSPRDRPALERAMPADAVRDGWFEQVPLDGRMVLFGDGSWRYARLTAWQRDRHGRLVMHLEWDGWTEWYLHDPERVRELRAQARAAREPGPACAAQ